VSRFAKGTPNAPPQIQRLAKARFIPSARP
jgi:hypothetical protein